ncbi:MULTISPECIES: zinc-ribbon domain-containing protein [unclassified Exiguobacterium]|uniref:zinc-ribbon domain-containing protein n=1 Tax=unclassified Exiguobacterium TaxID=2644629 RepID=UPI00103A74B6|nr:MULTISPECIES: zinc-ribbon domain-containing protein [unclassified Exiguobacterium]TCI45965.1 hypothetical protein EVJ31_07340 [Exiguobacterium sp. SH5S32]TCI51722.1 hypothetical protein EVJ25_09590 [Exiguobacterium sp. SH1S4]TCI71708.1 hypothetical protein EVJ23_07335 [Exiguobacterium sp. SH1S1]
MTQKPRKENNLSFACPDIAKEWNYEKNVLLLPHEISRWSIRKVWWICEQGHEWQANINNRTKRNDGCPYCSGRYPTKENCLLTINPELASEWHPTKNGKLSPELITSKSPKKVWWQCSKDDSHVWEAQVGSRARSESRSKGCPFCAGKKVSLVKNLAIENPNLALEWHPTKNESLLPQDVLPQSNKKVWWKCATCDHEWRATINNRNRVTDGRKCPKCMSGFQTSFPEQAIHFYLTPVFTDIVNAYILPFTKRRMTVDIFILSLQLAIEYDGEYAHKDKMERDSRKSFLLLENNMKLLRIREPKLPQFIEEGVEIIHRFDSYSYLSLEEVIRKIAQYLLENFVLNEQQIQKLYMLQSIKIEDDSLMIQEKLKLKRAENSLEKTHPFIAEQWHPFKNGEMKPFNFTKNSSKKVWWKCKKGHEYRSKITDKQENCLVCINKIVDVSNCLATTDPNLAKEWHPTKNNQLTANDVVAGSAKLIWWKCSKCAYAWRTTVAKRKGSKNFKRTGCPACSNKTTTEKNCLAVSVPLIAMEWHPTKNNGLTPYDVTSGSDKRAWWLCKLCGFEWDAPIYHRKKTGCPECGKKKIAKKKTKSNAQFIEEVKQLVGDEYIPLEEYNGATTKIDFLHKTCGRVINITPSKFISTGRRCKCTRYNVKTENVNKPNV